MVKNSFSSQKFKYYGILYGVKRVLTHLIRKYLLVIIIYKLS